jgi:hypothetical protein
MPVLLWLTIPVAALVIGIVWAYVLSRPPRPAAMEESMESFSRFRRALATHQGAAPRKRTPSPDAETLADKANSAATGSRRPSTRSG